MTNSRDRLLVSCKCALYSPDGTKVLLADYGSLGYGLPGGHINEGEVPDEAMNRELKEELGIKGIVLRRRDFFLHPKGKLILGYTGTLDPSTVLIPQLSEIDGGYWASVADIISGKVIVKSYKDFILANQPDY
jgi:8-oxo-dGTP pyrophosphatase MutT (NUDIX family)